MKSAGSSLVLVIWALTFAPAEADTTNPIEKVCSLIKKLRSELVEEGQESQKVYDEFANMCQDRSRELHREIKTGKATVSELASGIEKCTADIAVMEEKISDTASSIADAEADLKKANDVRAAESADFAAEEKELMDAISGIERAIATINSKKGSSASLAQLKDTRGVMQVMQTLVDASALNSYDSSKLASLLQNADDDEEDSSDSASQGAPVDALEDLLEKSSKQLDDARKSESESRHAHEMLTSSLKDKIKVDKKELADVKKRLAMEGEKKAAAQGDLEGSQKDLAEDVNELEELHHECLERAANFQESVTSRNEELKALTEAIKIIVESTGGAVQQTYAGGDGFVQMSFLQVRSDIVSNTRAVEVVRHLAAAHHSKAFFQLASNMETAIKAADATGLDPFASVKGLLDGMMDKIQRELEADASKKSFCDKEMAESNANLEDKQDELEKLNSELDVLRAWSKKLKREVAGLQKEISLVTKTQAEMDVLRFKEKALYKKNEPELAQGLEGVKMAMKVLREYYAKDDKSHDSKDGAGSSIIGMLEVVQSDFSKGLTDMTSEEDSSQRAYESETRENELTKAAKEADVKHKTKEFKSIDKAISETGSDRDSTQDEVDALLEYTASVKKECVANPEAFEERAKRRQEEIDSLRGAEATLKGEAVLLQQKAVHSPLRGAARLRK